MPSAIIIDDSSIMRGQLRKLLGTAGFTIVAEGASGDDVVPLYEKHRPNLITLDIVMPGTDGATAAADLLSRYPEAVIVMCTSLNSRDKITMCKEAGVHFYLLKPLNPEHSVAVFRRVLERATPPVLDPAAPAPASAPTCETRGEDR